MIIALVTGATSGLGRAFLEEWAARGTHFDEVWLVARHADALAQTAAMLPWPARTFAIDLSRAEERAQLFAALTNVQPQVQAVVNAAGYGKIGPVSAIDAGELSVLLQTGLGLVRLFLCIDGRAGLQYRHQGKLCQFVPLYQCVHSRPQGEGHQKNLLTPR